MKKIVMKSIFAVSGMATLFALAAIITIGLLTNGLKIWRLVRDVVL